MPGKLYLHCTLQYFYWHVEHFCIKNTKFFPTRFFTRTLQLLKKATRQQPRAQVRARLGRTSRLIDWRVSPWRSPTFLLFSSFPLIANLHRAYAEDDRDDEEKYTTDDARGDRLVLHPSRHRKLHLIAGAVVGRRVGEHLEIIGPTTNQILHCTRRTRSSWNRNSEITLFIDRRAIYAERMLNHGKTYPNSWFPRVGSVPCWAFSTVRPFCIWWCSIEWDDYVPRGLPRISGSRYWPPSPWDFWEDLALVLTIQIELVGTTDRGVLRLKTRHTLHA